VGICELEGRRLWLFELDRSNIEGLMSGKLYEFDWGGCVSDDSDGQSMG
jgi:hypothetical protein